MFEVAEFRVSSAVNQAVLRQVWQRAKSRCGYCQIMHPQYRLPFQVDHIIARQHGGQATFENLALACYHCNRFKGPNIAGFNPDSKQTIRLFNPRTDVWFEHFRYEGAWLTGLTSVGRLTVKVLAKMRTTYSRFGTRYLKKE